MTKIVAAVDNSTAARPVIGVALAASRILDAGVEAVHVAEDGTRTSRAAADAFGVPFRVLRGDPAEKLLAAAQEPDVVAVVLGIRSRPSGPRPAGGLTLDLITRTSTPLLVVPPDTPSAPHLVRVMVPLDASPSTARGVRDTLEFAARAGEEIVVVHVADEAAIPKFSDQLQHETEAWAEEFRRRYCPPGQPVHLELRVGVPADELLSVAAAIRPDLVIVAWSQDLSAGRAGIVRRLLERSRVPVMLVPVITASPAG